MHYNNRITEKQRQETPAAATVLLHILLLVASLLFVLKLQFNAISYHNATAVVLLEFVDRILPVDGFH
jgi:hypothetical protein